MKPTIFVALLLFLPSVYATDQPVREYSFDLSGVHYTCSLSYSSAHASPPWRERDPNPPLAVRGAVRAAKEYLEKAFPESVGWVRGDVILSHISGETWVYEVQMSTTRTDGYYSSSLPIRIVVLMDKTVVPYRPTPSTRRNSSDEHR